MRIAWWNKLRQWWKPKSPSALADLPIGKRGEHLAATFLEKLGYKILLRSARSKLGELDLVALDGRFIVFVEVKTRRTTQAGHPAEAVDERKQRKLTHVALAFLKRRRLLHHSARFDVIAITWPHDDATPTIQHYPNAFEATGRDSMFS